MRGTGLRQKILKSKNKERTKDGTPIYYVFVDESGHPYYDTEDVGPFVMAAVISDDPSRCTKTVLDYRFRKKSSNEHNEIKSSHSGVGNQSNFIDSLNEDDDMLMATSHPLYNQADFPPEFGHVIYNGTLSKLLVRIADEGPPGIYRIYVDDSEWIDEPMLKLIVKSAFSGENGRVLANHKWANKADSVFTAPIQAADMIAGDYRKALKKNKGEEYAKAHKIHVANRRRME